MFLLEPHYHTEDYPSSEILYIMPFLNYQKDMNVCFLPQIEPPSVRVEDFLLVSTSTLLYCFYFLILRLSCGNLQNDQTVQEIVCVHVILLAAKE